MIEPNTHFAVIGDYGGPASIPDMVQAVADLIKSREVDFIITVGDNNYTAQGLVSFDEAVGRYYHEYIGNYKGNYGDGLAPERTNNFYPALGNADWGDLAAYLDFFDLPGNGRYYTFTRGPVSFFALDSDPQEEQRDGRTATNAENPESVQARWLKQALTASTAPWKLVYMHHAPYVSRSGGEGEVAMRWPYTAWGATAVLAGHNHFYERLRPPDGGLYFVNGLGGTSIYPIGEPVPGSEVRFAEDFGAMFVEADFGRIVFRFVTRGGEEIDCVEVNKASLPLTGG